MIVGDKRIAHPFGAVEMPFLALEPGIVEDGLSAAVEGIQSQAGQQAIHQVANGAIGGDVPRARVFLTGHIGRGDAEGCELDHTNHAFLSMYLGCGFSVLGFPTHHGQVVP